MKLRLRSVTLLRSLFAALLLLPAVLHADIDLNSNGISDVWELLHEEAVDPAGDADGDGQSNLAESIFGTDPMAAGDQFRSPGLSFNATSGQLEVSWPSVAGKRYQLQTCPDLTVGAWANDGDALLGTGGTLSLSRSPGSLSKMYLRVQVSDVDTDGDSVSNWEEITIGLDPNDRSNGTGTADAGGPPPPPVDPNVVTVRPTSAFASEDGPAGGSVTFKRTGGATNALMVGYTVSGTATKGVDHTAVNAWFPLAANTDSKTLDVTVYADDLVESSESVTVTISWVLSLQPGGSVSVLPGSPNRATVIISNSTEATGTGLRGQYYDTASTTHANAANFNPAELKVTRLDATVNFDWLQGTPGATTLLASTDNYSVRWEGYLSPTTADHIFQLDADDKARVFLDLNNDGDVDDAGEQILENGWVTSATGGYKASATIPLVLPAAPANRYLMRVEFVETTGSAKCRLQWKVGTAAFVDIPTANVFLNNTGAGNNWNASYYNDINFATLAGTQTDTPATNGNGGTWGEGTPDAALVHRDTFSVKWTGQVQPQFSEDYTFVVNCDDAAKLWINGQQQTLKVASTANAAGTYTYNGVTDLAVITHPNIPNGSFAMGETVRIDPTAGSLTSLAFADYTIVAVGTGTITISVPGSFADQVTGATCNIEWLNKPIDWPTFNATDRYARISLLAGVRYDIRLDYFENTSAAKCQLSWYSPSQPKQIIPASRLYPANGPLQGAQQTSPSTAFALVGGPFSHVLTGTNGATVSITGKPTWLTFSGGVLSGTPPAGAVGSYQIIITTTSAAGTGTSVLNLTVEDNTAAPIKHEYWTGVTGTSVADTVTKIATGDLPAGTPTLTSLETPTNFGDDYAARVRGYISAPTTGNYYFWIAANNAAELWISNDDEPVNLIKRAAVTTGSAIARTWDASPSQKSPWIALEAGRRYYIEVLHKAGSGSGDNLAVGWLKPGQTGTVPSQVVPGSALSEYVPPAPGSTPGTLYVSTMLTQSGAMTNGVGTSTLQVSEDETYAIMRYNYSGLTGPISSQHIHTDAYLDNPSTIVFDIDTPGMAQTDLGGGLQPDGSYKWFILDVGMLSAAEIREIIKQGKAYINLHTALYPAGEIRGNYTLAGGSRTFTPPPAPPSFSDDHNTDLGAARFLTQATFGPNIADIAALKAMASYEAWIDSQFNLESSPGVPLVSKQLPEVLARELSDAGGGAIFDETLTFNAWWRNSIDGADQLRQRVAFALSEIHVVSAQGPLDNNARGLSYFYDNLAEKAFGNFRDILETTTLTPAMGRYLDMWRNDKPDQTVGRIPNENYGREIEQLFSIGLFRMWPDGTLVLDSSDTPVVTYTQREIVGFSHVFTGWDYGYDGAFRTTLGADANWTRLMREVPARHFTGQKRILNNEVLPGLTTVGGQPLDPYATHTTTQFNDTAYQNLPAQELDATHDQLFNHPNVGPFICRQLIQRLVTSHPSRDYLYRVAQKFNDNGSGVRGDMKAVIKAILLDYEARSAGVGSASVKPAYGKQREALLRIAGPARAFRQSSFGGTYTQVAGSHVINITGLTGSKLVGGNNVYLDFPHGAFAPGDTTPTSQSYTVLSTPAPDSTSFSVNAKGWLGISSSNGGNSGSTISSGVTGKYDIPASSAVMTVTLSGHWLPAGGKAWLDFGDVTSGPSMTDGIHTAATSTSTSGGGTTFTVAVSTDAVARAGFVRMVGFRGSYSVSNSNLAPQNERRITFDTTNWIDRTEISDHHMVVGDHVFANFTAGNPIPLDAELTIESTTNFGVPDANTFTVLTNLTGTGGGNDSDNGMWMFPLVSQPMARSGTVNALPSTFNMGSTNSDLDQTPINSPTVFNFFLPDFKFPGALASQGLTTPEFQDTAETTVVRQSNFIYNGLFNPGNTNGISSFKTGTNALVLDFTPWMVADATDVGLGLPTVDTLPWTQNQNIGLLIDQLCTLLAPGQISTTTKAIIRKFVSQQIASISTGNPCTVTTTAAHGLLTGDSVVISGVSNGTFSPTLNSTSTARTITVTGPTDGTSTTFTVAGVNCTGAPTGGGLTNAHVSPVTYNNGSTNTDPSPTEKRDRLRAIMHLIITSPDFTIQR